MQQRILASRSGIKNGADRTDEGQVQFKQGNLNKVYKGGGNSDGPKYSNRNRV